MRYFYGVKLFTRAQIQSLKSSWIVHSVGMILIIVIVIFSSSLLNYLKKTILKINPSEWLIQEGFKDRICVLGEQLFIVKTFREARIENNKISASDMWISHFCLTRRRRMKGPAPI